ncbi:clarin-3 [Myripristis murdjan]|uniref:Clarin 3 n=1 Tax=Myripristis murdjan TaxID=586833 RepID=A0A668AZR8_9TELE|nr:clarin-3 [Myripristis murdjan]
MPSRKKTLHFLSSALVTSVSVGILGYAMSTTWAAATMDCAPSGNVLFNGTAVIEFKLFNGSWNRINCPFFGRDEKFQVFPELAKVGGAPIVLHSLSVGLLVLCLLFSAVSILISLYNSVSNPYETYMGPVGFYASSSLSACLSLLVIMLFVVNINVTDMAEDLVKKFSQDNPVDLRNKSAEMQIGYYLVIPYMVLSLLSIALIYMYEHAAYTHKKEQQRPTEDAPKEIMMY